MCVYDSGFLLEMRYISDNIKTESHQISTSLGQSLFAEISYSMNGIALAGERSWNKHSEGGVVFSLLQIDAIVKCLWPHNKSTSNCKFVSNMCTHETCIQHCSFEARYMCAYPGLFLIRQSVRLPQCTF